MFISQSDKKNFAKILKACKSASKIEGHTKTYTDCFRVYRHDHSQTATRYMKGLLFCHKGQANMERMEEEVHHSEYRVYQHFISNSSWDWQRLQKELAQDTSKLLVEQKSKNHLPTGYIIDESSHLKKGTKSVGVSRQYAGVIGKVDNCQVGVYSSLVNATHASLINERLFLPKSWTEDKKRCQEAKIPEEHREFKTKPELALEMIKQDIERGIVFDWIGGDALYGHNPKLCKGIDDLGRFFVLDIHCSQKVFLAQPTFSIPQSQPGRGRKATKLKPDIAPIRLDKLQTTLTPQDRKKEEIRDTLKGKLFLLVHKREVWIEDQEQGQVTKRTLIITQTTDAKPKIKYSISNGGCEQYTHQQYGYFVAQRYWVERSFDNAKNELGLSDYQVRKWQAWHTHHAIVMMASLYVLKELIQNSEELPLLSFRDVRILIVASICATQIEQERKVHQMLKRHEKPKRDIDFCFRKQKEKSDS